ncbi:MAG: signal peptidase II, partial [Pseudomonadota bacterium]
MKNKLIALSVVSVVVIALDQITKNYILGAFQYGESVDVIKNYFNITYVRNYGAAFGMLGKVQANIRDTFFLLMPPFAMTVILVMLRMAKPSEHIRKIALCAVFAGAMGNYIDRLRFGYVVDFLDFHYHSTWAWPAFNVADMSIVCGVTALILLELFAPTDDEEKKT